MTSRSKSSRTGASKLARTGSRQRLHSLSYSPVTVPWTTMPSLMRSSHRSTTSGAADRRDPATPPSSLPGISMRTARRADGWCSRSETLHRSAVMCVWKLASVAADTCWAARVGRTPDTGSATCRRADRSSSAAISSFCQSPGFRARHGPATGPETTLRRVRNRPSGEVLVEERALVDVVGRVGLVGRDHDLQPLAPLGHRGHRALEHDLEARQLAVDVVLGLVLEVAGGLLGVVDD